MLQPPPAPLNKSGTAESLAGSHIGIHQSPQPLNENWVPIEFNPFAQLHRLHLLDSKAMGISAQLISLEIEQNQELRQQKAAIPKIVIRAPNASVVQDLESSDAQQQSSVSLKRFRLNTGKSLYEIMLIECIIRL